MPRVAVLATAVVAVVLLAVVFTRPDGGSGGGSGAGGGEVFLQAAGKSGPDPFTESTAKDSSAPPVTPSPADESVPQNTVRGVDGGAPGLYGGTRKAASCDVEKQISFLRATPEKNRAFASVVGVGPAEVPAYLRSLTPVQLRLDTRVTNHGYRDGAATSYQAVLQAGTAVLVDDRGVPRVRCACGNPLTPPVPQRTTPRQTGDSWPSYRSSNVVAVLPAPKVINTFVLYDPDDDEWIQRKRGDTGGKDRKAEQPKRPSPSVSVSTAPQCTPGGVPATPCPPTSTARPSPTTSPAEPSPREPSPEEPSPEEPSPEEPSPEEPSPEPPSPEQPGTSEPALPESPEPPPGPDTTTP